MVAEAAKSAGTERPRVAIWNGELLSMAFQRSAGSRPWTEGYRSLDVDRIVCDAVPLSAPLPKGLRGTFFRNGPARHERGGQRYGHRWDGDGMLQRFQFTDRGVSHVGQYIHTEKYNAETAKGRFERSAFGTHIPGSDAAPDPIDVVNVANISVLHFAGELLALWELDLPTELSRSRLPRLASRCGIRRWPAAPSRHTHVWNRTARSGTSAQILCGVN